MTRISYLLLFACGLCLLSCNTNNKDNVDHINLNIQYHDLHLDLANVNKQDVPNGIKNLEAKYGSIIHYLFANIIGVDTARHYQDSFSYDFFNHPDLVSLHDTVKLVFAKTEDIQTAITDLYKRIHLVDSNIHTVSQVYFYTSGLHNDVFLYNDTILGVGLDRFLGPDFWPYEAMQYPRYITNNYIRKNIPVEIAKLTFNYKYGIAFEDRNLLEMMIQEGKQLYFMSRVLPDFAEATFLGYTQEQMEWCEDNEIFIYKYFTDQNLLFEKNPTKIMRYVAPAPTSMGMPDDSPGRTAAYIGWQIIKSYEDKTDLSLYEIMNGKEDAQTILTKSKYKPKK